MTVLIMLALASAACSGGSSTSSDSSLFEEDLTELWSKVELSSDVSSVSSIAATASQAAVYSWLYERSADVYIASCMREAGFEFFPIAPDVGAPETQPVLRDSRVDASGYEFINQILQLEADRRVARTSQSTASDGPNNAYVDSLTPNEAEAYSLALFGESGSSLEALAENRQLQESGLVTSSPVDGCLFEGRSAVLAADSWNRVHDFANRARLDIRRIGNLAAAHPDVVEVHEGWRRCMVEMGFEAVDRADLISQVTEERLVAKTADGLIPASDTAEFRDLLVPTGFELSAVDADLACSAFHPQAEIEELAHRNAEHFLMTHVEGFANLELDWNQLRPQIQEAVTDTLGEGIVRKVAGDE